MLLKEELLRMSSSKPTYPTKSAFFKSQNPVHQVEIFEENVEEAVEYMAMEIVVA